MINRKSVGIATAIILAGTLGAASLATGSTASVASGGRHGDSQRTSATEPAFATVTGGEIMGARVAGVYEFKGIQYATADRYQEPQPAFWDDTRKALAYGEICPNGATTVNVHEFVTQSNHDLVENEATCLNLNVWSTQAAGESSQKPVVVWLHGGGFSNGSSAELPYYDGANLAANQDVVFVSVNHRLNQLGYLDLSAYGPEYATTGNLGQLDLIAALRWVQDNAAQFGGDASNVTIVGQSGGAGKVMTLLGMPSAQGLFSKAVAMSGGSSGTPQAAAQAETAKLFTQLGISTVEELKALPYAAIHNAAVAAEVQNGPVIDGDLYPSATVTDGIFTDLAKGIPLLVSNTFGEFCGNSVALTSWTSSTDPLGDAYRPNVSSERVEELLGERFGDQKEAIVAEFRKVYPTHDLFDLLYFMAGCGPNRIPTADAKAAQGGAAVYSAVFAMNLPWFGGVVNVHTGGDLPFILDNAETIADQTVGAEKDAARLAAEASGALGNFARTGDPSGRDTPAWPAYTAEDQWTMIFDTRSAAVPDGADRKLIELIVATQG